MFLIFLLTHSLAQMAFDWPYGTTQNAWDTALTPDQIQQYMHCARTLTLGNNLTTFHCTHWLQAHMIGDALTSAGFKKEDILQFFALQPFKRETLTNNN